VQPAPQNLGLLARVMSRVVGPRKSGVGEQQLLGSSSHYSTEVYKTIQANTRSIVEKQAMDYWT
jgi:hypothetical protein